MTTANKQAAYQRGHDAEHLAAAYLEAHDYEIIAQRYKTAYGEIDLIAQSDNCLVFIEVKARKSHVNGLESISAKQRQRIIHAANHYLTTLGSVDMDMRFDVITVSPDQTLQHIENAWDVDVMASGF